MNSWKKSIIAACLFGIFEAICMMSILRRQDPGAVCTMSDIMIYHGFGFMQLGMISSLQMVARAIYLFVFQILSGIMVYERFSTIGVYFFTRCENRERWFLKEAVYILGNGGVYFAILGVVIVLVSNIGLNLVLDPAGVALYFLQIIIYSLWSYIIILLLNILSLKLRDSGGAFLIVVFFQIVMFCILALLDLKEQGLDPIRFRILKWNPMSHLVMAWHTSKIDAINEKINMWNMTFDFKETLIVFLILAVIVTWSACRIVKKQDIIVSNRGD